MIYRRRVEVLKEQHRAAESRATLAEAALIDTVALRGQVLALEAQAEQWKQFYSGVADMHSPEDVVRMVTALREETTEQTSRISDIETANACLNGLPPPHPPPCLPL